jgi:acyl-coenzyme A thioesterase PaaI-like protein
VSRLPTDEMTGAAVRTPVLIAPRGHPEQLFRLQSLRLQDEQALCSMVTGEWLADEWGRPLSGAVGVLMDCVLANAATLHRPAGKGCVTTELGLDFFRPLPMDGSTVFAAATSPHGDGWGGFAEGQVQDETGATLLHGTSWLKLVDEVPRSIAPPDGLGTARGRSLKELLAGRDSSGGAWTVPQNQLLTNPRDTVHGGVLTAIACYAAARHLGPASGLDMASIHASFVRPAVGELTVSVTDRHPGRSFRVVDVVVSNPTGKPCLLASVTFRAADRGL